MVEEVEVASIRVEKEKNGKLIWWKARLLRHSIVGDYKIIRQWSGKYGKTAKSETEWLLANKDKFFWKIIQKVKLNNYKIKEYNSNNKEFGMEFLQSKLE